MPSEAPLVQVVAACAAVGTNTAAAASVAANKPANSGRRRAMDMDILLLLLAVSVGPAPWDPGALGTTSRRLRDEDAPAVGAEEHLAENVRVPGDRLADPGVLLGVVVDPDPACRAVGRPEHALNAVYDAGQVDGGVGRAGRCLAEADSRDRRDARYLPERVAVCGVVEQAVSGRQPEIPGPPRHGVQLWCAAGLLGAGPGGQAGVADRETGTAVGGREHVAGGRVERVEHPGRDRVGDRHQPLGEAGYRGPGLAAVG